MAFQALKPGWEMIKFGDIAHIEVPRKWLSKTMVRHERADTLENNYGDS